MTVARLSRWKYSVLISVFLSLIFATSTLSKAISFEELKSTILRSALVVPGWETGFSAGLLIIEGIIALALLMPFGKLAALYMTSGLTSIFFGYNLWRSYQDIRAPCGCFGILFKSPP
jgi:hypothetical protein